MIEEKKGEGEWISVGDDENEKSHEGASGR